MAECQTRAHCLPSTDAFPGVGLDAARHLGEGDFIDPGVEALIKIGAGVAADTTIIFSSSRMESTLDLVSYYPTIQEFIRRLFKTGILNSMEITFVGVSASFEIS